jgi:sporulation protein YlmC with PRC-barrel domain
MHKLALALLVSAALAVPALAQKKDEPKTEAAKKVEIPKNVFFKGQTANQYLAKDRLLGAKVVNKSGETVGTIDDLIVTQGGQIEGVVMGVGGVLGVGAKQIGVRLSALKISTADGKFTVTLPDASKEMLGAVGAYQRATPGKK